jgi:hypothetical protein
VAARHRFFAPDRHNGIAFAALAGEVLVALLGGGTDPYRFSSPGSPGAPHRTEMSGTSVPGYWRSMEISDLDGGLAFPDHFEDRALLAEQLALYPRGCFSL